MHCKPKVTDHLKIAVMLPTFCEHMFFASLNSLPDFKSVQLTQRQILKQKKHVKLTYLSDPIYHDSNWPQN